MVAQFSQAVKRRGGGGGGGRGSLYTCLTTKAQVLVLVREENLRTQTSKHRREQINEFSSTGK